MKKTSKIEGRKLSLRLETVRSLTREDLTLVVGGVCKLQSDPSLVLPPPDFDGNVRPQVQGC